MKEIKAVFFLLIGITGIAIGCEGFPALQPGDVDVSIRTEKQTYCPMEPVFLEIGIHNHTNQRICVHVGEDLKQFFYLSVLDPYRPKKVIPMAIFSDDSQDDLVIPEHQPTPVPLTRAGAQPCFDQSWREHVIAPHGKYIIKIPLSLWYDLSYPCGKYTVNIKADLLKWDLQHREDKTKSLVVEKTCSFVIDGGIQSSGTTHVYND